MSTSLLFACAALEHRDPRLYRRGTSYLSKFCRFIELPLVTPAEFWGLYILPLPLDELGAPGLAFIHGLTAVVFCQRI